MATRGTKTGAQWRTTSRGRQSTGQKTAIGTSALRCRRKFLRFFPGGFADETYLDWERDYKWKAHERWVAALGSADFRALLRERRFGEIAAHAVSIESRTNLLFSFEKMALRDAVRSGAGARRFANGLFAFLHGPGSVEQRFAEWCEVIGALPRTSSMPYIAAVFGSSIAEPPAMRNGSSTARNGRSTRRSG